MAARALAAKLTNGDKMTIEMMLTHTTGMKDYFDVPTSGGSIADGATDKAMLTRAFTPEELVKLVADSGLSDFEPGAEGQWNYSNTGYMLLGLIIEKASGKTYEENLKERIFEPLGLEQTYLQAGQPEAGAAPGVLQIAFRLHHERMERQPGLVGRRGRVDARRIRHVHEGPVYREAVQAAGDAEADGNTAPTSANRLGPGVTYAHGMTNNNGVLGHGGQTLGFQSDGGYIPDKDVTIVIWSSAAESNASRARARYRQHRNRSRIMKENTDTLRPSDLALSSYGSPLRKPVIGWLLGVALAALIIYSLRSLMPFFSAANPQHLRVFATALAVTGAITAIPVLVLRWLDRREPEPWLFYALAFAWGGLIATAISADINTGLKEALPGLFGAILSAPFVEEAAKGLGLLVFVLLLRDEFDGPRDGLIYGALIGLGFIWLESSVYIVRSFDENGTVAWAFQIGSRYVLAGLNGHAIYTGLTGTFIGFALIQRNWLRKLILPIAGYV